MVLPLLLLFVFGCVDFGRVAYVSIAIRNAAGAGVAYGATHRFTNFTSATWTANVQSAVREEIRQMSGFDASALTTDVSTFVEANGIVRVTVSVTYPFQTAVSWPGLPTTVTLRHQVTAQQYR